MTTKEIRKVFLDFFAAKGHQLVPSAPIVLQNDATLMFTNAGMNQFKDIFLGDVSIKYPRVVDTQRCLRASGKHNDLEEVGIDTYHHTMFEMLGNWSFGDYFKKEAIAWSWQLLTEVYGLSKERLYVTVFEGNEQEGLAKDQESYDFWKSHIAQDRILFGNKRDNFWEMGETGPCGPCSEIHVDCRSETERALVDGSTLVNKDHPQVIEIWNNVFIQFNRLKDASLHVLSAQHVDTGMGLERLVRVLQGKKSNYDTDVFQPLIQFIVQASGIPYDDTSSSETVRSQAIAMRVMADHIRAIAFAIADGQLPSNNKAGYVIRRILRRSVRYAYTFLNFKEPSLYQLIPILADQFEEVFPELKAQESFVQKVILEEERSFLRTLSTGMQRFDRHLAKGNPLISGDFAFELYDTFGFPIDLTALLAREKGLSVDKAGFEIELAKQKNRSRLAGLVDVGDWVIIREGNDAEFVGYDDETLTSDCQILKYRQVTTTGGQQYQLVINKSPFYAESGGQIGDTGKLMDLSNSSELAIIDTRKENGLTILYATALPKALDGNFLAVVDQHRRAAIEHNHSATHLLHAALKQVLGLHVNQKGSFVNEEHLRFDFSYFTKVTDAELAMVEAIVNEKICENIALKEARAVAYQQAIDSGVTALFGEKYGDFVRVITFDDSFSKELCGGTHVRATGEIGYFKITSESAVAAGVRRIEAITGGQAQAYIADQSMLIDRLKQLLKTPKEVFSAVEKLLQENDRLKKELEKNLLQRTAHLKHDLVKKAIHVKGICFIAQQVDLPSVDAVKTLAYAVKDSIDHLFLVLASEIDAKPHLAVMLSEDLVQDHGLHAGNIVRELAKEIQGGGGGQSFFATAGGKDCSGMRSALEKATKFIN